MNETLTRIRTALQGRKTYGIAAIAALYLLGVWAGWWAWDEKVLAALGAGGLATLAAKINRQALPLLLLIPALAGCARFATHQQEIRNEQTTTITTDVSAWTLFESRSSLANFAARQSAATQSATVGSLNQESSGTNTAATLSALAELLRTIR